MMLPILGLGAIALAAFVLQMGENKRFLDAIHFLLFLAVGSFFAVKLEGENQIFFWSLVAMVALNFAASHLKALRKDYVRAIVPLLTVIGLAFFLKDRTYDFLGSQGVFVNKFLVTGLVLTAVGYELSKVKLSLFNRFLGSAQEEETVRAILVFLAGVGIFLCNLEAGPLGLLALSGAFLSTSFYREVNAKEVGVSLLMLTMLPVLMFRAAMSEANLMDGDVLEGIFIGAFGMYFIQKLMSAEKRSTLLIVLIYSAALAFAFGLLFLSTQFVKMGGMDAFVGVLVGAAVVNAIIGKGLVGASFMPLLLAGGLILPKYMVNDELEAFNQDPTVVVDENGQVVEPAVLAMDEIAGTYSILSDSSRVSFELGENGETKGAFKKVSGKITVGEDPSNSSFDVVLKMKDFTTFNGVRDESLLGEDYFNAPKNPEMTYKGSKMVSMGDNEWEIQGEFTMLGVKKALPVKVKRIDMGDRKILTGSGAIDRTLFGMQPSPSEGNVVSFTFKVELK